MAFSIHFYFLLMALCHPKCITPPKPLDIKVSMGGSRTLKGHLTSSYSSIEGSRVDDSHRRPLLDYTHPYTKYHRVVLFNFGMYDKHRYKSIPEGSPSIGLCTSHIPSRHKDIFHYFCLLFSSVVCESLSLQQLYQLGSKNFNLNENIVYTLCYINLLLKNVLVYYQMFIFVIKTNPSVRVFQLNIDMDEFSINIIFVQFICFVWVTKMTPYNLVYLFIFEMVVCLMYEILILTLLVNTMVSHLILYINTFSSFLSILLNALIINIHSLSRAKIIYIGFVGLSRPGSVEVFLSHLNADRL